MSHSFEEEADRIEGVRHPRHAARLFGQADHERALLDAHRAGRLPHAIILGGAPGIGKATLAWRLAKFLLVHPSLAASVVEAAVNLEVPIDAKAAVQANSLSHPDLVLLRRELNEKTKRFYTEIRADDVRRAIGLFHRAAGAGGYRICIVDSADDLNRSSANALLKIIEEPPPASLFLIVAHRPGLILPTIRSRARLIRLDPLGQMAVAQVVTSLGAPWSDADEASIRSAASLSQGSVHDALRLLARNGNELGAMVHQLLDRLPTLDWRAIHKVADAVTGREAETAYDTTLRTVFDWLAAHARREAGSGPRRLAPFAEVWEKVAQSARETDALNLDKRPLILSIFSDLAVAVRASSP